MRKAWEVLAAGGDPVEAVVSGVNIVENDPDDVTVGYGGIPNEEGVVQLDASVMDGRTMKAGAVGALERIKNPSRVAKLVMERTSRVFLVGEGALRFARAHGWPRNCSRSARAISALWKERLSNRDDWRTPRVDRIPYTGLLARRRRHSVNAQSMQRARPRRPRVSQPLPVFVRSRGARLLPLIGAGLYVDGEVGAADRPLWQGT